MVIVLLFKTQSNNFVMLTKKSEQFLDKPSRKYFLAYDLKNV